jgi:regulator of protease activity HflC (stomatin/prohibitin superfamily)
MTKRVIGIWIGVGTLVVLGLALLAIKPYDRPEYVEIGTSESAFLIPLEGDTANQASFQSVQFLRQKLVAAKRIRITHRWNQLGFWPSSGEWIADVKLIKVDRRPVTREWTQSSHTGTSPKNEAVAVESKDSVNFSMGVSCTAHIPEELAPVFLYSYPAKSLAEMMDSEVRARIQQVVAEEAAKYDLDLMRSKKNEIMKAVREDVLPFFKAKGIEITTVAMVGGLTYDNPEIQKAIDEAAKSSQLKVSAEARREAQEVENKTLKLAAEAKAQAIRLEAEARAHAALTQAEADAKVRQLNAAAEAQAIRTVADAKAHELQKATESPTVYLQLKSLDMEIERWKRWDGKYPAYLMQFGAASGSAGLLLQPPAASAAPISAANK